MQPHLTSRIGRYVHPPIMFRTCVNEHHDPAHRLGAYRCHDTAQHGADDQEASSPAATAAKPRNGGKGKSTGNAGVEKLLDTQATVAKGK